MASGSSNSSPRLEILAGIIRRQESLTAYYTDIIVRRQEDIQYAAEYRDKLLGWLNDLVRKRGSKHFGNIQFRGAGSYFKGTQVEDVDEFDILVECWHRYRDRTPNKYTEAAQLVSSADGSRLSSTVVQNELKRLLEELQAKYSSIRDVRRTGSSVKMTLFPRGDATARPIDFDFIVAMPCEMDDGI